MHSVKRFLKKPVTSTPKRSSGSITIVHSQKRCKYEHEAMNGNACIKQYDQTNEHNNINLENSIIDDSQQLPCNQLEFGSGSLMSDAFEDAVLANITLPSSSNVVNGNHNEVNKCNIDKATDTKIHVFLSPSIAHQKKDENRSIRNSLYIESNSQVYNSTQYRREIENVFNQCEMSICGSALETSTHKNTQANENSVLDYVNIFDTQFDFGDTQADPLIECKTKGFTINQNDFILKDEQRTLQTKNISNVFYGLPLQAKSLISQYKNVDALYDWQDECLNLEAVLKRKNLIYALPTSGGKTLVAEILMLKEVLCNKKNVLFILPFVAIVQEKVWGLSPFAVELNFLVEEYAAGKGSFPPKKRRKKNTIFIATLEKGLGLIRSLIELDRLDDIGLIVIDELHLIGDPSRGSTLEMLLTSVMFTKNNIQIVGMSATIGNINELADFLKADVYTKDFRPVELNEYLKIGETIMSIIPTQCSEHKIEPARSVAFRYSPQVLKLDPDHLGGLVMEVIPHGSCLIFCPTKKNCENVVILLCKVIFKQLLEHKAKEKQQLIAALKSEGGGTMCSLLAASIPWGIAYHHSGLTSEERRLLEHNFRSEVLSVFCCTSTLAAGVNLPAQRVILRSPFVGRDFISLSTYKQMVGRAGRAGYGGKGESILICPPERLNQVSQLLSQPMEKASSNMHANDASPLKNFILSAISLKIANTRSQLRELVNASLMGVQAERLELDINNLTDKAVAWLFKYGVLEVENGNTLVQHSCILEDSKNCDGQLECEAKKIIIYNNTVLVGSKLGIAAIKGCIDLKSAQWLRNDLQTAQKSLVVMDESHILYLVTPYEYANIKPNLTTYYAIYSKLSPQQLQTAHIIGLTEANALRMLTGKTIKNIPERDLNRFYVSLMLYDLWKQVPIVEVADRYEMSKGTVQTMLTSAACFASSVLRFCEEMPEFWAFRDLLAPFSLRLQHCCTAELLPLMDLPSVKKGRAMQLYKAGYKTIHHIAKANPLDLVDSIEYLSRKGADTLISNAKLLLIERVENLREEAEEVLQELGV